MTIRDASKEDFKRIAEIYSYYVENTAVSFELIAPSEEEMHRRYIDIRKHYPYLAAEVDGKVIGYAYCHELSSRDAYRRSVETSIYVDEGKRGSGAGRALYEELERRLKDTGVHNLYAIIAEPGIGSEEFHRALGYRTVGKLTDCGEKFGRLWSVIYMEKRI